MLFLSGTPDRASDQEQTSGAGMTLSEKERRELTAWLADLTEQMEDLARRVRVLAATVARDDGPMDRPPPPDG